MRCSCVTQLRRFRGSSNYKAYMQHSSKISFGRLWRRFTSWDTGTLIFASAFLLTFMAFNAMWCAWTTFTPFSHLPLYVSSILMTLLLTLPYVLFHKRWIEILLLVLLDFMLVANLMYARTYFNAIPLTSYTNAGNLADFMPSVWASLRWFDLMFPLITCTAIYLVCRFSKRLSMQKPTDVKAYLVALSIPVLITIIAFPTPGHFKNTFRVYRNNAYAYQSTPVMYSIFGNLLFDTLVAYEHLTPAQEQEVEQFVKNLPGVPHLSGNITPPLNLVVIFCESLESWAVGLNYEGQQVTPNLDAMLMDSTTYYNPYVLSQAKDGRSIDGQLLTLTGLLPLAQGTYATQYPDNYYPSIHKALHEAHGSRNILMTGDKEYAWNQGHIARNMGMDTIISFPDFRLEESFTGRSHIGDRALMRQCVEKLRKGDIWSEGTPAFVQIVTYSGHGPFRLPESEKKIKIKPGTPQIMADYMQTARYTDEALGLIIAYLRSRDDWEDTMVVITGDHEGLAAWREECLASELGRKYVSKEQYVPLIILNSPLPGRGTKVIGQVDIYSTILHLMGLSNYSWPGIGYSALDTIHPGMAISPQSEIVTLQNSVNENIARRLRQASDISDRIIRYNLLSPKVNSHK